MKQHTAPSALSSVRAEMSLGTASRRRLPPEVRAAQIFEAALREFSLKGYEATRMDDIARGAGLSKGGLYAHFKGKAEVFDALLAYALPQIPIDENRLASLPSVVEFVDELLGALYSSLAEPRVLAILRLLVAEGARAPDTLLNWRNEVTRNYLAAIKRVLQRRLADGTIRRTALAEHPWLLIAPALYPTLSRMVPGGAAADESLKGALDAHKQVLCELLEPRAGHESPRPESHQTKRTGRA